MQRRSMRDGLLVSWYVSLLAQGKRRKEEVESWGHRSSLGLQKVQQARVRSQGPSQRYWHFPYASCFS
jgi:hypothetical protein